jgi:hypothetical protein
MCACPRTERGSTIARRCERKDLTNLLGLGVDARPQRVCDRRRSRSWPRVVVERRRGPVTRELTQHPLQHASLRERRQRRVARPLLERDAAHADLLARPIPIPLECVRCPALRLVPRRRVLEERAVSPRSLASPVATRHAIHSRNSGLQPRLPRRPRSRSMSHFSHWSIPSNRRGAPR